MATTTVPRQAPPPLTLLRNDSRTTADEAGSAMVTQLPTPLMSVTRSARLASKTIGSPGEMRLRAWTSRQW